MPHDTANHRHDGPLRGARTGRVYDVADLGEIVVSAEVGLVRTTCKCHCATCGCHFNGQRAFDLHRAGDHEVRRYCVAPADEPRLAAVSEDGWCAISGEHDDGKPLTLHPVTVWGLTASRDPAAQARFAALRYRSTRSRHPSTDPDQDPSLAPGVLNIRLPQPAHVIAPAALSTPAELEADLRGRERQ